MKTRLFLLLVSVFTLWSCDENDPDPLLLRAASAEFFFDATSTNAVQNPDGSYTITATGARGTMVLNVNDVAVGYYQFNGAGNARYETPDGRVYTSLTNPEGFAGAVNIRQSTGVISGTFKFKGFSGNDVIDFFQGEFQGIVVGAPDPVQEEGE